MTRPFVVLGGVLGLVHLGFPSPGTGQAWRALAVSRPIGTERLLRATLEFGLGSVIVMPAAPGTLYSLKLRYDPDRYTPVQQYEPRTGILHLGAASVGSIGVRATSGADAAQTARFEFSSDVPLELRATFSASDATLDLGGMTLVDLALEAAATHATLDFSQPTRGACRSASFTVGASQLAVRHLAGAGCASLRVDGGAGTADLAFDGAWRRDATLVVDLTLGTLMLRLPRGLGVRITGERFLAPFKAAGFSRMGEAWLTAGYDRAPHKLIVELKAAIVRIDVNWIDDRR